MVIGLGDLKRRLYLDDFVLQTKSIQSIDCLLSILRLNVVYESIPQALA